MFKKMYRNYRHGRPVHLFLDSSLFNRTMQAWYNDCIYSARSIEIICNPDSYKDATIEEINDAIKEVNILLAAMPFTLYTDAVQDSRKIISKALENYNGLCWPCYYWSFNCSERRLLPEVVEYLPF